MNLIQYIIKGSDEMKKISSLDNCLLDLESKGIYDNSSIRYLIEKEKEVLFEKLHTEDNFNYFLIRIEGIDKDDLIDMTDEEVYDEEVYFEAFEEYLYNEIEDWYLI